MAPWRRWWQSRGGRDDGPLAAADTPGTRCRAHDRSVVRTTPSRLFDPFAANCRRCVDGGEMTSSPVWTSRIPESELRLALRGQGTRAGVDLHRRRFTLPAATSLTIPGHGLGGLSFGAVAAWRLSTAISTAFPLGWLPLGRWRRPRRALGRLHGGSCQKPPFIAGTAVRAPETSGRSARLGGGWHYGHSASN